MTSTHNAAFSFTAKQLESLLRGAVTQILEHQDPRRFLEWMRANANRFFGHLHFVDDGGPPAMAAAVARSIWNSTPLPDNHFKPQPIPEPGRNDPCPCGSGSKYKRCCAQLPELNPFTTEEIWAIVAQQLPGDQLHGALQAKRVPAAALGEAARRLLEAGHAKKAAQLLEPLFEKDIDKLDERFEPAFDALCDAYQELGHDRKRHTLVDRVTSQGRGALASAAWQRLAAMCMDRGEHDGAWQAFHSAQKADPGSPSLALSEVTLLLAEHRTAEAAARAKFWVAKLRKEDLPYDDLIASLEEIARDPQRAVTAIYLQGMGIDSGRLRTWIEACTARPLPKYDVGELPVLDSSDPAQTRAFLRDHLTRMGVPADQLEASVRQFARQLKREEKRKEASLHQRRLFEEEHDSASNEHENDERIILTPNALMQLEAQWHAVYPCGKPFGTAMSPMDDSDPWESEACDGWLGFLEAHPEAGDAVDVLDDLATAVIALEERLPQGPGRGLGSELAERGCAILLRALGERDIQLPWGCIENRPALRLLARAIHSCLDRGEPDRAADLMRTLIRLNPNDNHGFRGLLVNYLLRKGEDAAALEVIARYPRDMLVEVAFGEVLAHLRRGDEPNARAALSRALEANAFVPRYLTAARSTPPRLHPQRVSVGGRDQAWLYREDACDIWAATPGALEWLKRQVHATRTRDRRFGPRLP